MDIYRKIGIGIVMIIPGFVLGGLIWELLHSWLAVLAVEIGVGIVYHRIITGKFLTTAEEY